MEYAAGIWAAFALPALALAPLAVERGRSPWWGLWGLASYVGLAIGLICLFAMQPGNQAERMAYGRYERGEITAEDYEQIRAVLHTQRA